MTKEYEPTHEDDSYVFCDQQGYFHIQVLGVVSPITWNKKEAAEVHLARCIKAGKLLS